MKLSELLDKNVREFGEYPFIFSGGKQYTNVETMNYANQLANGLRNHGVDNGERVIVIMPNSPEVLFAYQGITRAGAVIVPVMYTLHPKEIAFIADNCGAKLIITSSLLLDNIGQAIELMDKRPSILVVDAPTTEQAQNFYDYLSPSPDYDAKLIEVMPEDTAVILYTSGTTGNPKGVKLTHRNLCSNAENSVKHSNVERGTTLGILPLAHVFGLTISHTCYIVGSSIVVFPRFEPKEVLAAIEAHKVRAFSVVPAMIHALVAFPTAGNYDTSSLESVSSGSAPLPIALLNTFEQKFGAKVYEGYGLSEAAPIVTAHTKDRPIKPGSVGIPIPGVTIKIVNEKNEDVPRGEIGELLVRGDNVTPGYFRNDEETDRTVKEGWLYTGDLGRLDDEGYLYIVDRKKDLIIRGGFNIYSRDLEEILSKHSGISEVAVVGVPDERMGEELVACVVKDPSSCVLEEELILYCQDNLAKHKTPKRIIFLDSLPRNGVGKILKTHLRKMVNVTDLTDSKKG
ncbi:class I adenylate-forming enzyme family protein [Peribacillus sp. NPDC097206]|uniref:class I adenylate-forming enzyme family protein n=1 Tax=unclassified Peribacillus TaxID=2675266 RepID=UPI00381B7343